MTKEEVEVYLKKIRQTIAESEAVVAQAELRIAETDRMLEREGITREQALAMKPTREQLLAVNEELERRGLARLELDDGEEADAFPELGRKAEPNPSAEFVTSDEELENRRRKFTTLMQNYRL